MPEDQMTLANMDVRSSGLSVPAGSALLPVTPRISFENLLGKKASDMSEEVRRARWEEWKKLAPEAVQYWQPENDGDPSSCHSCKHLRGDWCALQELPATVNPILSFRHGIPGMACMGAGHEPNNQVRNAHIENGKPL